MDLFDVVKAVFVVGGAIGLAVAMFGPFYMIFVWIPERTKLVRKNDFMEKRRTSREARFAKSIMPADTTS